MKYFLLMILFVFNLSAIAAVDEKFVEECKEVAIEKLDIKANDLGAKLDERTIEKLDEEKKVLSKSAFVWFKAEAYNKSGDRIFVTTITEKPLLPLKKPCF